MVMYKLALELFNPVSLSVTTMVKFHDSFTFAVLFISTISVHAIAESFLVGQNNGAAWEDGHATFYGDMSGGETMQGACGYGNLFQQGYGFETAALSTALFNKGQTCGACFEIMCVDNPQWCIPGAGAIRITATNFCPPNYDPHFYPWCNPPRKHFDLSMPMFTKLAPYKAGIIPVKFHRVHCVKRGGIKFEIKGNPNWITATPINVGGAGDVAALAVMGSKSSRWVPMTRSWGQVWQTSANLVGQSLSFHVTTSDRKMVVLFNVAPGNWKFGQTYEGKGNL